MNAKQKLSDAAVVLLLNHPFYASMILPVPLVPDTSIKTACTNGKLIKYNPAYIEGLSMDETITLLAHEAGHPALLHHIRGAGKEPDMWNKASDYALNELLVADGFHLPKYALLDARFKGMEAESVYAVLYREKQEQKEQPKPEPDSDKEKQDDGFDENGDPKMDFLPDKDGDENSESESGNGKPDANAPESFGEVETPDDLDENLQEYEAEAEMNVVNAMNTAKMQGQGSPSMERIIQKMLTPYVDWREMLQRFVAERAKNDYSWTRPNTRYLAQDLFMPSLDNLEVGKLVVAVDVSGSVNDDLLTEFSAEFQEVLNTYNTEVMLIYCDDKIQGEPELFSAGDEMKSCGYGGTSFIPPFEWVENNMDEIPKALIYFTDGECWSFAPEPDYPVLWIVYNNDNFKPPYGEVSYVKR